MGLGPFDSLIFPVSAIVQRVDTVATESASGYNHRFREPTLTDGNADGIGEPDLVMAAAITIPAQVEKSRLEDLTMGEGGDIPETMLTLTFSRGDLRSLGLIDSSGRIKLRRGMDRLIRLDDPTAEKMWTFDQPPGGLYLTEIGPADSWIGMSLNHILAVFEDKPRGPRA